MAIIGSGGGGSGSGAFARLFDSTVTGSAAASIDSGANGIPQATSHLYIVFYGRGDTAATAISVALTFNNDTAAHYDLQALSGGSTSPSASFLTNTTGNAVSIPAASATANVFGSAQWIVPAYTQTTGHKGTAALFGFADPTGTQSTGARGSHWQSTAAITRIAIAATAGNLVVGSRLTVYGLL